MRRASSATSERLAIDGGPPASDVFLRFGAPALGEREIAAVVATLRSGWIGTGPVAAAFEQEFAAYVGSRHALAVNSCTSGLFLSLLALDIGSGDEVITTPLTFAATANVIEHVGARPVFADIDPATLTIDPEAVERAITPRTRAILPVHFGGLASDMRSLRAIAARHELALVEDAAHAVGTRLDGRMAGTLGRMASFSFYANKNLTTAEGGMVTTDDDALAERVTRLRLHGLSRDSWQRYASRSMMDYQVVCAGYKSNMPDILAAIGLEQLRRQEQLLALREQYARKYDAAFAGLPVRRQTRPADTNCNRHSLHLYVLTLDVERWRRPRNDIVSALLAENIGAAIHYLPVHEHEYYRRKYQFRPDDYPQAHAAGRNSFSLPLSPAMSEADVDAVILAVRKAAAAYACS
jgi:dTDP-4-amino-4,6-dideoxygalactose transaminase